MSSQDQPTGSESTSQTAAKSAAKRGPGRPFAKGQSGNPSGKPRAGIDVGADASDRVDVERRDGWWSAQTGFGTELDKRTSARYAPSLVGWDMAANLWRGNWLAAKAIEKLPNEATRAGFCLDLPEEQDVAPTAVATPSVTTRITDRLPRSARRARLRRDADDNADLKKRVADWWKSLDLIAVLKKVDEYRRAYGGGALLLGADDGQAMNLPLDAARIKSLDWVTALEHRELQPLYYYTDIRSPKFGQPSHYQICPTTKGAAAPEQISAASLLKNVALNVVHETRLIVMRGIEVSRYSTAAEGELGDGILGRVDEVIRDYDMGWDVAGALLQDFAQGVYQLKDLANLILKDGGGGFRKRMLAMERSRSALRAIALDVGESFERKTTPVTGVAEILREFRDRVAAALDMPLTVLFGVSPGGLNATGESDLTLWRQSVGTHQANVYVPALEQLTAIAFAIWKVTPTGWSIKPNPLHTPSPKEEAERRKIVADTDVAQINAGMVDAETVARSRWGGPSYSAEMVVDFDEREAVLAGELPPEARDPLADPTSPPPGEVAPTDIAATVMNGAQINAMLDVLARVTAKEIPLEAAQAVLEITFQMSEAEARRVIEPLRGFASAAPAPAPGGFGGGSPVPPAPPVAEPPRTDVGRAVRRVVDAFAAACRRRDYDPDQPRAEDGKWGEGGPSGGSSSKGKESGGKSEPPAAKAPKASSESEPRERRGAMREIHNALSTGSVGRWVEGGPGDDWQREVENEDPARGKAVRAVMEGQAAIEDGDLDGAKEKLKAAIKHFEDEGDAEMAHMIQVDLDHAEEIADAHGDQRVAEQAVTDVETAIEDAKGEADELKSEASSPAEITRMEKAVAKLEAKIEKMKAKGEDATDEESELDDQKAEIIVAQELAEALPGKLEEIKSRVAELKTKKKEAAAKVRAAEKKMSKLSEKLEAKKGGWEGDIEESDDLEEVEEDDPDEGEEE